jgi:integrase
MAKKTKGGLYRRGKVFWARWYSDGQRFQQSTGCTSRREAEKELEDLVEPFMLREKAEKLKTIATKVEGLGAAAAILSKTEVPLVYVWQHFTGTTSRKLPRPATLRQYEVQLGIFRDWVQEKHPERKTVEAIDRDVARQFVDHIRSTRTANTANKYLRFLSMVWQVLREEDHTEAENPWAKIRPVEVIQHSRRELTLEELRKVCGSATGDLKALLAIGIYTGLRLGDAATLKWSEVDLERGIICRIPSKSRKPKPVLIPVHRVLRDILLELERAGDYVLPRCAADYQRHPSYVTDRVQRLFISNGITTTAPGEKGRARIEVGFHSLRHTFVSLSRTAGAPLAVVEAIVGHSNPAMTRHYSHVGDDASRAAVGLLPSILTADEPTPAPGTEKAAVVDLARLRKLVAGMTEKNWKTRKRKLLEVLP